MLMASNPSFDISTGADTLPPPLIRAGVIPFDIDAWKARQASRAQARKLLTTAALLMSVLLIGSALVTTLLIPHDAFLAAMGEVLPEIGSA